MTVKQTLKIARDMCGNDELADELLDSITLNCPDMTVIDNIMLKYCTMCIDRIKDSQAVNVTQVKSGMYKLDDYIDASSYIVIIDDTGKITFYERCSEYANLAEYAKENEECR